MSIYALKPRFQALLRPAAAAMFRSGISANEVTLGAAVASVAIGAYVAWRAPATLPFLGLPVWMLLRMALNALDGVLAREFGQKSVLGAYLNELGDVVADAALYAPFAFVAPFAPGWVVAVIILAGISEFAGVLGPVVGASRRYDGPMGKSDRAFVFGALGLWIGLDPAPPAWVGWILPVIAALCVVTIVNRVRRGVTEAQGAHA